MAGREGKPEASPTTAITMRFQAHSAMTLKPANDELISAAAGGDRLALNDLLLLHFDSLHEFIQRRLPARLNGVLSVDDAVQETLVRAIRGIRRFELREGHTFEAWLMTVARHTVESLIVAADAQKRGGTFRRQLRGVEAPTSSLADLIDLLTDDSSTASAAAARKEAGRAVQVGIACLPDEQQEAVRLRYLQGQSVAATADALGRSPAAVRGLLHRARTRLRDALGHSSRWFSRK
jgi:RNA polymerase sigma-70 factor (ECF subfamily)